VLPFEQINAGLDGMHGSIRTVVTY
jgi:hypothetical protein